MHASSLALPLTQPQAANTTVSKRLPSPHLLKQQMPLPSELAQQVGENARTLRLAQNLSRKTLAERAGISESTIKRFETTGQITLDALVVLASSLGVAQQLSGLFTQAQPVSLDELKQSGRVRGRK